MRLLILPLLLTACASAQEPAYPKFEWFGAYSALRTSYVYINLGEATTNVGSNAGFEASAIRNLSRYIGIKGDFSAHFGSDGYPITLLPSCPQTPCSTIQQDLSLHSRLFNFLAGPELKLHRPARFTPFLHALYGVEHTSTRWSTSGATLTLAQTIPHTAFAMVYGGGLDVRITHRAAIRYSVDYSLNFHGGGRDPSGERERLDTLRMSVGILFH
jgi:opacity protein-like surface antigen